MEIIKRNQVEPFVTKDTSLIREIMAPANSSIRNQSLAEATVKPGKATDEHYHPNTEEIYYILNGKGNVRIENETKEIKMGDAVAILPGMHHKIWNTGEDNLVFLCCCAPAYSHQDTVITE